MRLVVGEDWPYEFNWDHIGKTFQKGLLESNGDWVIRMDLDYFFRKKDLKNIRNFLKSNQDAPAVAFPQFQIFTPRPFSFKDKIVYCY